jgi:hypothetical protein
MNKNVLTGVIAGTIVVATIFAILFIGFIMGFQVGGNDKVYPTNHQISYPVSYPISYPTSQPINQNPISLGGITNYDSLTLSDNLIVGGTVTITGATSLSGALTSGTFTQGGGIRATSTIGTTIPLLASDFDVENVIDVTLNVQDATLSFPATSTLTSFIPNAGDTRTIYVRNATTTASMDITISGGTGVLLKKATSTAVVYGDTDGANFAKIDLTRKSNTDIEALLNIYMD